MALERMLKRSPQDEVGGEEKRPRREDHIELCTPTFKLLAPKTLASAIQFSHLVIENAAQGKLHLTEPEDLYPGTEQQVVTIESPAWENIASAMKHILAMANNCTECVMPGHEDERRLAIVMPSRSISALIGVKGANVKELQLRTGCHIHVDDVAIGHGPGGDRAVNINGLPAGLEQAIVRTVEVVQESHDQVWFRKWAERSNAERLEQEQAPPLRGQVLRNSEEGNGCMGSMMGNMAGMMMGNMMGGMGGMVGVGGLGSMGAMGPMGGCGCGGCGGCGGSCGCGGCNNSSGCGCGMGGCAMAVPDCGMGACPQMSCGGCGCGGCGCGCCGTCGSCGCGGSCGAHSCGSCGSCCGGCSGCGCGGCGGCGGLAMRTGANLVIQAMEEMPAFVSEDPRGFILRSAVPTRMAEALQHKAMQVTGSTNTKISFSGDSTSNARVMSVQGALFNICAGFMLMMRHYLEIERELCQ